MMLELDIEQVRIRVDSYQADSGGWGRPVRSANIEFQTVDSLPTQLGVIADGRAPWGDIKLKIHAMSVNTVVTHEGVHQITGYSYEAVICAPGDERIL